MSQPTCPAWLRQRDSTQVMMWLYLETLSSSFPPTCPILLYVLDKTTLPKRFEYSSYGHYRLDLIRRASGRFQRAPHHADQRRSLRSRAAHRRIYSSGPFSEQRQRRRIHTGPLPESATLARSTSRTRCRRGPVLGKSDRGSLTEVICAQLRLQ